MSNFINKIPNGLVEKEVGCTVIASYRHSSENLFEANLTKYKVVFSHEDLEYNFDMMKFIMIMKNLIERPAKYDNPFHPCHKDGGTFVHYYQCDEYEPSQAYCVAYIWSKKYSKGFRSLPEYRLNYNLYRCERLDNLDMDCKAWI